MKEFESTAKAVVRQCRNLRIEDGIHHDLARQSRDRIEEWPQRTQGTQIGIGKGGLKPALLDLALGQFVRATQITRDNSTKITKFEIMIRRNLRELRGEIDFTL